jgi:hypothetical protein
MLCIAQRLFVLSESQPDPRSVGEAGGSIDIVLR